jgi:hypothetical protein
MSGLADAVCHAVEFAIAPNRPFPQTSKGWERYDGADDRLCDLKGHPHISLSYEDLRNAQQRPLSGGG